MLKLCLGEELSYFAFPCAALVRSAFLVGAISLANAVYAEDLGRYGNLWSIEEEDGVDSMLSKLKSLEKDGTLRRLQEKYRDEFVQRLENPQPLPGISPVAESRTYFVDPSITVNQPIVDDTGKVIVAPGERINPLDYTAWTKSVVLIDGRDARQVDFAWKRLQSHPRDKVILVGGSYLELMRSWKVRVYYDLGGAFTSRFNLKNVPAIITQVGKQLEVQEIAMAEKQ